MTLHCRKKFRLFSSALVVCFLMTQFATPAAAETKFSAWGDMDFSLSYTEGADFNKNSSRDNFAPRQRVRLWFKAQTSEDLSAWAMFRMATGFWGMTSAGGKPIGYNLDADQVNLRTRFLFLNWTPTGSSWSGRMGIIPAFIPYASYHSGVLDTSAAGIDVSYKFNDIVTANAIWMRPFDEYSDDAQKVGNTSPVQNLYDEMDMFMFKLPVTLKEPNISVTPWTIYSAIGKDSGFWNYSTKGATMTENGKAFWSGVALKTELTENLLLNYDVLYGSIATNHDPGNYNTRGWQTSASLDYKQPWGTPGLFGWYATGSDADKVQNDSQWGIIPNISVFDIGFNPTSFGFQGGFGVNQDSMISYHAAGRWGVGAQIQGVSFFNNMSHTLRFAYYRGTNDKEIAGLSDADFNKSKVGKFTDPMLMTRDDSAIEIDLNHDWKLGENVNLYTMMGYINLDRGDVWKEDSGRFNAWQLATNLRFKF